MAAPPVTFWCPAMSRDKLRLRHAEHYLEILGRTSDLYEQGGEGVREALELFDREWENVRSGFHWTAEHASEDKTVARLCAFYPNAGAYCLDLRLSPSEHIQWLEPALAAARRLINPTIEAAHLGSLGNAYMSLNEIDHAISLYREWLEVARKTGDRQIEGASLGNLGIAHATLNEPRRAIELFEQHLFIAREIGDRHGEGIALGRLGDAYASLGEPRRAWECYEQALALLHEIGDRPREAEISEKLGGFQEGGHPRTGSSEAKGVDDTGPSTYPKDDRQARS